MARIGDRFKTGDTCDTSGVYDFDGYVDGSTGAPPSAAGRRIPLSKGERFPPAGNKAAYWKLTQIT